MEQCVAELRSITELLKKPEILKPCCEAALEFFFTIILETTKEDRHMSVSSALSKATEALQGDNDLAFMTFQALRRFRLFCEAFLIELPEAISLEPNVKEDKYVILRKAWLILNMTEIKEEFGQKIREIFALTKRLLNKPDRTRFEKQFQTIIAPKLPSHHSVQMFDDLVSSLNPQMRKELEPTVFHAMNRYFININHNNLVGGGGNCISLKGLKAKSPKRVSKKEVTALMKNPELLRKALELDLFKSLGVGVIPPNEVALTHSICEIKRSVFVGGQFGDIIPSMNRVGGAKPSGAREESDMAGSFEAFLLLNEIYAIKTSTSIDDSLLTPTALISSFTAIPEIVQGNVMFCYEDVNKCLKHLLINNKNQTIYDFLEVEALCIVSEVAKALKFIHSKGFAHNNVNEASVYFCFLPARQIRMANGEVKVLQRRASVKLANFAVVNDPELPSEHPDVNKNRTDDEAYLSMIYKSPELLQHRENSTANDIYGLGILLWRLLHFKVNPVLGILSGEENTDSKSVQHSSMPTDLGRMSIKTVSSFDLSRSSLKIDLNLLPRKVCLKKLSKYIHCGKRPKLTLKSRSGPGLQPLRDRLIELVCRCWDDQAFTRPTAENIEKNLSDVMETLQKKLPINLTVAAIIGGIQYNLKNRENHTLKSAFSGMGKLGNGNLNHNQSLHEVQITDIATVSTVSEPIKAVKSDRIVVGRLKGKSRTKINKEGPRSGSRIFRKQKTLRKSRGGRSTDILVAPKSKRFVRRISAGRITKTMGRKKKKMGKWPQVSEDDLNNMQRLDKGEKGGDDLEHTMFEESVRENDALLERIGHNGDAGNDSFTFKPLKD